MIGTRCYCSDAWQLKINPWLFLLVKLVAHINKSKDFFLNDSLLLKAMNSRHFHYYFDEMFHRLWNVYFFGDFFHTIKFNEINCSTCEKSKKKHTLTRRQSHKNTVLKAVQFLFLSQQQRRRRSIGKFRILYKLSIDLTCSQFSNAWLKQWDRQFSMKRSKEKKNTKYARTHNEKSQYVLYK